MYRVTTALFGAMATPAPLLVLFTDSHETAMAWVGYGIICALLALTSAVAAHSEK